MPTALTAPSKTTLHEAAKAMGKKAYELFHPKDVNAVLRFIHRHDCKPNPQADWLQLLRVVPNSSRPYDWLSFVIELVKQVKDTPEEAIIRAFVTSHPDMKELQARLATIS